MVRLRIRFLQPEVKHQSCRFSTGIVNSCSSKDERDLSIRNLKIEYLRTHRPKDMVKDSRFQRKTVQQRMWNQKRRRTLIPFNKELNCAARARNIMRCREIFQEIERAGLEPDVISYNTILKAAHGLGDLNLGVEFWKRMAEKQVEPDIFSYSSLISNCRLPFKRRPEDFPKGRLHLARELWADMQNRGLSPDLTLYNSFIDVLCKAGCMESVEELYKDMMSKSVVPNVATITSIMSAYTETKNPQKAVEIFNSNRGKMNFDTPVFNSMMDALTELGLTDEVIKIWKEYSYSDRNPISSTIFAKAMARAGRVLEVENALRAYPDYPPLYNVIICEFYGQGDIQKAISYFLRGYGNGVIPVWSKNERSTLDLHWYPSAVACCAVRHFAENWRENVDLSIIVGRGLNSTTTSATTIGDAIRHLLDHDLNISYHQLAQGKGGLLTIDSEQLALYSKKVRLGSTSTSTNDGD